MASNTQPPPKRGATIILDIEKFADKGMALARVDGFVILVREGVPGDRVKARVYKRKKRYAEAEIEEVLEPSALRTEPRCYYFSTCGGCKWQHVQYEAQLQAKRESVAGALQHQGGFALDEVEVRPTIGA
ncbi:MAG: TRAM domain-containing protein, partial [Bacteroidetes bacterium]|nr:TRAM domain-containing protein [Bacteroidota bacterium]